MLICLNCKHIFDDDEVAVWDESRGEYWGTPCYEKVSGCPCCKGDYEETHKCDCCDEWIVGNYIKTDDGQRICDNCYFKYELGDED